MFASMNAQKLVQACGLAGVPSEVIAHIERHKDAIAVAYQEIIATEQPAAGKQEGK